MRRGPALVVALALPLAACASRSSVPRGAARPGLVEASGGGQDVVSASVPLGPERCGNARDDNGNGLIDEGCGSRTGPVQFVIAWDAPSADVDLLVTDPRGELAEVGRATASGLIKDRDCPGKKGECHGENFEDVYLDKEAAPHGAYRVKIRLQRAGDDVAVRVTLGARVGLKSYASEIELRDADETASRTFLFTL